MDNGDTNERNRRRRWFSLNKILFNWTRIVPQVHLKRWRNPADPSQASNVCFVSALHHQSSPLPGPTIFYCSGSINWYPLWGVGGIMETKNRQRQLWLCVVSGRRRSYRSANIESDRNSSRTPSPNFSKHFIDFSRYSECHPFHLLSLNRFCRLSQHVLSGPS